LDVAACVGDTRELQQALHRAVFAEFAVQDGQYQVETDRLVSSLLEDEQSVDASVRRQNGRTASFPICVKAVTKLPGTARRDPDVERFVLREIEVPCDLLRGFDGDRMFFGTAPEDDPDLQPMHADLFLRRPGSC